MSKLKDTLLLLFWGIVAGAFFVGCILGFMSIWNHAHEWLKLASIHSPLGQSILSCVALASLAGVIYGAVQLISWIWTKVHKGYWEQAEQIFPQEMRFKLRANALTKAILDGNDYAIMQYMGKKRQNWARLSNAPLYQGITPLHVAAAVGNKSACEGLLYFQADPLCPDRQGRTPMDYATQANHLDIIKLFQKHISK